MYKYKSIFVFNGFTNLIMGKSTFIFSAPEYLIVDTSEEDKGKYPPSSATKRLGNNSELATPEPFIIEIDWRGVSGGGGGGGGD